MQPSEFPAGQANFKLNNHGQRKTQKQSPRQGTGTKG